MKLKTQHSNDDRFIRLLDNLIEGFQIIGPDWRYLYVNQAGAQQGKTTKEQLVGRTMMEVYPGIETTELFSAMKRCMETRVAHQMENQFTFPDGSFGWFELRIEPIPEGVFILSMDITERKRAEEQLRETRELFQNVFHLSPVASVLTKLPGRIVVDANAAFEQLFGYTCAEVIGRPVSEIDLWADPSERQRVAEVLLEVARIRDLEFTFKTKSGSTGQGIFYSEVIDRGADKYVLTKVMDITERKQLQEHNLRLQRMESIGSLAGGIVHDMNNILGPIMMALGSLRKKLSDPTDHKMVELLERNSKRAADLVRQVLTFARGSELKRSPLKPTLVLDEVLKLIRQTFPANISINVSLPKDIWSILADVTQIHQVLMNLAVNARDAMPHGGTLTFEAEHVSIDEQHSRMFPEAKPGLYVLFKITDTGTGMPPEVKSKIFDPFFTTKEIGKGTGLGLSTVLSIVKAHRGVLDVHSEVGKGTEFRVYLPAIESKEAKQTQQDILEAVQGNGELILVVDDDAIVREIATLTLEAGGYKVITAADGTEALGLYGKHQPDIRLVITDTDMPIMDGPSLVRILRKMSPQLSIIGSSGSSDNPEPKEFGPTGLDVFLPKPYTSEMLLRLIYETLHQK